MLEIKTMGNTDTLKGMFIEELRSNKTRVLKDIPVSLLTIDTSYQTPIRTNRDINYLVNNWSERKLLPLIVVPHFDVGLCYVVDGWGRANASQIVDRNNKESKYEYLSCLVLLDVPEDETERRKFEAMEYAFQNRNVAAMKPIHRHGAFEVMGDKSVLKLNEMQKKYGFTIANGRGSRASGIIGSYTDALDLCKPYMGDCAEYVFDLCRDTGFSRMTNGYARYILRSFRDCWRYYPESRKATQKYLARAFRGVSPTEFKANAVTKYPRLNESYACSLFVEDLIVDRFGFDRARIEKDGKIVIIDKTA